MQESSSFSSYTSAPDRGEPGLLGADECGHVSLYWGLLTLATGFADRSICITCMGERPLRLDIPWTPEAAAEPIRAYAEETNRRKAALLTEALNRPENRNKAASAILRLIERIVLTPGESWGEVHATLHGDLATILEWTADREGKNKGGASPPGTSVSTETGTNPCVQAAQVRSLA